METVLVLEDGTEFRGRTFGHVGRATGEVVFSTSMSGYQELLTDASYAGQILVSTLAHVGNTGVNPDDNESGRPWLSGFVVQDVPRLHSNWRATQSLSEWMAGHGLVGICDVDTRALVKHIREKGAMLGGIGGPPEPVGSQHPVAAVSCRASQVYGQGSMHVVAYDFGIKQHMLDLLVQHGMRVTRVPFDTPAEEALALQPDGIFLSNGPGDPAGLPGVRDEVRKLLGRVPLFGICLGHQLLALALGARTYKLKFGHRGSNQPVKHLATGHVEITSQNHGYAVDVDSLPPGAEMTHLNLNDHTCEGLKAADWRAFSVQYHPENSPGPHDSRYLFQQFVEAISYAAV